MLGKSITNKFTIGLFFIILLAYVSSTFAMQGSQQIESLLSKLTIEEKVGQLNLIPIEGTLTDEQIKLIKAGSVGGVLKANGVANNLKIQKIAVEQSRAGIPILFQEDVIHGYKTIAPVPLAEAASWDLEAIEKSAAVAAREASAAGIKLTYAPMVDVSRDPRWGRIIEAAGEDPYLGSLVAAARVKGFQQGNKDTEQNILATVKHFAGYGASLAGRDYNIRDISERELREIHLPPFKAAIEAGVSSVMGAYTAYDGVPATANKYLMDDILRQELGFNGLLMTDWETIPNLVKSGNAKDKSHGTVLAMGATFDMDMTSQQYLKHLPELVRNGAISEAQLDNAVRRVLRLKQLAGLLDDPYQGLDLEREKQELLSKRNWKETKDIALKSLVLLKNQDKVLPIKKSVKHIAVIGPLAKAKKDLLGWWHAKGEPEDVISIYEGIKHAIGKDVKLSYAQGVTIDKFKKSGASLIPEAVELAKQADLVVLAIGEQWWMSGEGGGTASLNLPGLQEELTQALAETDTPIVTLVVTGRPYVLTDIVQHSTALIQAWMPGTTGGEAIAEVLTGQFNPQGKLPVTFPIHQGQIPIFYNYKKTSHSFDAGPDNNRYSTTYRDVPSTPLFPFGYGLNYSEIELTQVKVEKPVLFFGEKVNINLELRNNSNVKGTEVVQVYIRDKVATVTRPVKELKAFTLATVPAKQKIQVKLSLDTADWGYLDQALHYTLEAGEYEVFVGFDSRAKSFGIVEVNTKQ